MDDYFNYEGFKGSCEESLDEAGIAPDLITLSTRNSGAYQLRFDWESEDYSTEFKESLDRSICSESIPIPKELLTEEEFIKWVKET